MAITITKISEDNTVENREDVEMEISEPITVKTATTLKQLRTERDVEQGKLESYQVSIGEYDALILQAETEADKVILKTP